jgi:hypothetical protein
MDYDLGTLPPLRRAVDTVSQAVVADAVAAAYLRQRAEVPCHVGRTIDFSRALTADREMLWNCGVLPS